MSNNIKIINNSKLSFDNLSSIKNRYNEMIQKTATQYKTEIERSKQNIYKYFNDLYNIIPESFYKEVLNYTSFSITFSFRPIGVLMYFDDNYYLINRSIKENEELVDFNSTILDLSSNIDLIIFISKNFDDIEYELESFISNIVKRDYSKTLDKIKKYKTELETLTEFNLKRGM